MGTIQARPEDIAAASQHAITAPGLIICGVIDKAMTCRRYINCWHCSRVRLVAQTWSGSIWYGDTFRCTHCGDTWSDGELWPRPFRKGWRKEAIAKAKACVDGAVTRAYFKAVVQANLNEEMDFLNSEGGDA